MPSAQAEALAYVDASALVKLVIFEPETATLRDALRTMTRRVSSRVANVEVLRAVEAKAPEQRERAQAVLAAVSVIELNAAIAARAARLRPAGLRALDAIHVATALSLGDAVSAFVSYDQRQLQAARSAGLNGLDPGMSGT